jgi:hypothetical protein
MIPPLFLNPKGNDKVFDMCAAPGIFFLIANKINKIRLFL